MYRPRLIPTLQLNGNHLVKSKNFKNYNYIGDPINSVRIFNEMLADEIIFMDINASREKRTIDLTLIKNIAEEANMPFSVGGGIQSIDTIKELLANGAEKVILGNVVLNNPSFITKAVEEFGASTIAVCLDVKKKWFEGYKIYDHVRSITTPINPLEIAISLEKIGVGEIIIQSVDKDGMMSGYDLELINSIASHLHIPIVALGGAGSVEDMKKLLDQTVVSGLAAGSMFIYKDRMQGVLINYPEPLEKHRLFQ
ncbi:MAG: AglZ/HisF2 family acetamidino modification protein [Bacteroidota bacterium]